MNLIKSKGAPFVRAAGDKSPDTSFLKFTYSSKHTYADVTSPGQPYHYFVHTDPKKDPNVQHARNVLWNLNKFAKPK